VTHRRILALKKQEFEGEEIRVFSDVALKSI
jgi:hypothetical protein